MKALYIIKTGITFPNLFQEHGDFDLWTGRELGDSLLPKVIVDAQRTTPLPEAEACAGIIITGSHAMVTDKEPWSVRLEIWIRKLVARQVPIFGICYGHQLLAAALGGQVDYHPHGKEIGTVNVARLSASDEDPLFRTLPAEFLVHATHAQTVVTLPPGALRLAANEFEPNHAFRLGPCAWGVQFHPEYNTEIMRGYIEEQSLELAAAGRDVTQILARVAATPVAQQVLANFTRFCEEAQPGAGAGQKPEESVAPLVSP